MVPAHQTVRPQGRCRAAPGEGAARPSNGCVYRPNKGSHDGSRVLPGLVCPSAVAGQDSGGSCDVVRGPCAPEVRGPPSGSVRRGDVEAFGASLPLAPSSARLVLQHFSALCEAALADGLVPTNPLRGAKRPKADSPPIVPLSGDQLEALAAAAPPWFVVAVTLGAGAGLRQAESTGLSVDRVDFLHRHLRVDRQLLSGPDGTTSFGPPKTARSYRTVPLADSTLTSIAHHLEHFGTGEHGLVLHEDGRPVHANRFGPLWQQTRRRAGLRLARFHDCRHTFASILLHGGVSVPAAAEYLGHTPAVLLSTYAHLVPSRSRPSTLSCRGGLCQIC